MIPRLVGGFSGPSGHALCSTRQAVFATKGIRQLGAINCTGTGSHTRKQGNLAGNWTALPADATTIDLRIGDDVTFTWKVTAKGKPRQLTGKRSLTDNLLTLAQEGDQRALIGRVAWQADDKWSFRVIGTGPEDQGLLFTH